MSNTNSIGWVQSFNRLNGLPLETNKIWDTLTEAQDFIVNKITAVVGDTLSVTNDPIDENNGLYLIKSIGENGLLEKVGFAGEGVNVQSDWNETDSTSDAFIKNKPAIPDVSEFITETQFDQGLETKQDVLVSSTNIKTLNGESLLGSGDLKAVSTRNTSLTVNKITY